MDNRDFTRWCKSATRLIKFPSDQEAVSRELQHHLEDRYDALITQGLSPEEATERSLAAMGNPDDIAPQLAAVHKPFWGYVSAITGFIAVFLVLFAILFSSLALANGIIRREEPEYLTQEELHYSTRILYDTPSTVVYTGEGYRLKITKVALWEPKYIDDDDTLSACIQVKVLRWPFLNSFDGLEYFYAVDDRGTIYAPPSIYGIESPNIYHMSEAHHFASQTINLGISGIPIDGIQWLELRYDRDGRSIVIPIDFSGGEDT